MVNWLFTWQFSTDEFIKLDYVVLIMHMTSKPTVWVNDEFKVNDVFRQKGIAALKRKSSQLSTLKHDFKLI